AGQFERAMDLSVRQFQTAGALPEASRLPLRSEATAVARRVIERWGAIVEPVRGQFTLGSPESYHTQLGPVVHATLRRPGYLPRPARPIWDDLWNTLAPFRLTFEVSEHQDDPYLGSPNRVSRLDGKIVITRNGATLWRDLPSAATQIPLPRLPAYQAS